MFIILQMAYGKSEIIVLPIMLVLIVILSFSLSKLLNNKPNYIKRIILASIPTIMLVMEIVKQITSIINGYSWFTLPLHFCSLYMIWFSFAEFGKGRFREFGQTVSMSTSILFLIMFYINPTSIIGNSCSNVLLLFLIFILSPIITW